jgi:hypothetical protein
MAGADQKRDRWNGQDYRGAKEGPCTAESRFQPQIKEVQGESSSVWSQRPIAKENANDQEIFPAVCDCRATVFLR